ncbi:(Fe-S)-binding protein [Bacteroidia bacterium]|nr:(Fe-S)-binding protein [Bacteroidia bacterium]MDB4107005.1 (Fe-S)-binding protein [Bacteroidia bacterium]MDB9882465.1 (Fe-S)-binding protein [Bacteroidia bacterium]
MQYLQQIFFIIVLGIAIYFFIKKIKQIRRNIFLGKEEVINDNKQKRWKNMARVALGQSKMVVRPVAGILHIIVYVGFVLINIEVLEIVIDGIFGTHRALSFLGPVYDAAIGFFEILALLVLVACLVFLGRRFISKIPRFHNPEMKGWATKDALYILIMEVVLMAALLYMNAADQVLQSRGVEYFSSAGSFPVSHYLTGFFTNFESSTVVIFERVFWWFHILGILFFLNYVPYSKHLHIFLAFPNTWYSKLKPAGEFANMPEITNEVNLMMDPSKADPNMPPPEKFGVSDVTDLSWKNLLDAYTCTECGRCTSSCPANITGKKLSPRKIMMDTRARAEELGVAKDNNGADHHDGKSLHDYISQEELLACTTCNACVEACPVNINPMEIIFGLRQYQTLEKSAMPSEWAMMNSNIENNQAPWQFSPSDRANWTKEI